MFMNNYILEHQNILRESRQIEISYEVLDTFKTIFSDCLTTIPVTVLFAAKMQVIAYRNS